jgi:hypothetical protein
MRPRPTIIGQEIRHDSVEMPLTQDARHLGIRDVACRSGARR